MGDGDFRTLTMHMARSNDQWKSIDKNSPGLAIVHGSEAYISPSNYGSKATDHRVIPTWN
jgi:transcriptional regulator